jgi:hypothetical protein
MANDELSASLRGLTNYFRKSYAPYWKRIMNPNSVICLTALDPTAALELPLSKCRKRGEALSGGSKGILNHSSITSITIPSWESWVAQFTITDSLRFSDGISPPDI